jgi:hypothetical protein
LCLDTSASIPCTPTPNRVEAAEGWIKSFALDDKFEALVYAVFAASKLFLSTCLAADNVFSKFLLSAILCLIICQAFLGSPLSSNDNEFMTLLLCCNCFPAVLATSQYFCLATFAAFEATFAALYALRALLAKDNPFIAAPTPNNVPISPTKDNPVSAAPLQEGLFTKRSALLYVPYIGIISSAASFTVYSLSAISINSS